MDFCADVLGLGLGLIRHVLSMLAPAVAQFEIVGDYGQTEPASFTYYNWLMSLMRIPEYHLALCGKGIIALRRVSITVYALAFA